VTQRPSDDLEDDFQIATEASGVDKRQRRTGD
jgi:hypothetical protein